MRTSRALAILSLLAAGCFSPGPDPNPSATTEGFRTLYVLPIGVNTPNGQEAAYVGSVLQDSSRLVVVSDYLPSFAPNASRRLMSVPKDGSPPAKLADLQAEGAMIASDAQALYVAIPGVSSIDVLSLAKADGATLNKFATIDTVVQSTTLTPAGLAVDDAAIYLLASPNPPGDLNVFSFSGGQGSGGKLVRVDKTTGAVTTLAPAGPQYAIECETSKTCLWLDAGALYFVSDSGNGPQRVISKLDLATHAQTTLATVTNDASVVGVAFDATSVYWVESMGKNGLSGCNLQRVPKAGGSAQGVARDTSSSCLDLVVDGGSAYVAWAEQLGNGSFRGTGLARAPLSGGAFSVTPFGRADSFGVLRLEIDATTLYGIGVNVVVAIPRGLIP